jgi:hypothetical protein
MFTRNKVWAVAAVFAVMPFVQGQDGALDRTSVKINLPADSPVALVSADWGESRATARGGAMLPRRVTSESGTPAPSSAATVSTSQT